jgi:TonB family protein
MGTLFVFSLKASVMLAALYTVYKIAFRNSTQHDHNRTMLLSIVTISLLCSPILALVETLRSAAQVSDIEIGKLGMAIVNDNTTATATASGIDFATIAITIYAIGVIITLCATLYNIAQLALLIARGQRSTEDRRIIIANSKYGSFSWFGYIIMTEEDYHNNYAVISCHERQHIQLRHSADLLYLQVYKVINWYNPIAYLVCRDLQVIHEYQADAAVLSTGFDAKTYQMLLLSKVISTAVPAVANGINNSQLKLRIIMMLNKKPTSVNRTAAAVLTPIAIIAAVVALNQPVIASTFNRLTVSDATSIAPTENVSVSNAPAQSVAENTPAALAVTATAPATDDKTAKTDNTDKTDKTLDAAPTYFIDDVESTPEKLNSISPSDIKSMQVIKNDPAYPNGKLMIYTNKPATGKTAAKIPTFVGGEGEMIKWLSDNITYPTGAPKDNNKHSVVVEFTVTKSGEIANPTVIRSESIEALDAEAVRVVSSMPKWEPGQNENGEAVDINFTLPITFYAKK